jgi:hypothetical protein
VRPHIVYRVTVPQNISRAQRDHPRIYCAEDACGRRLGTTSMPKSTPCSWCGGFKRRYEYGAETSVITNPQFEVYRTYYQRHPRRLAVQLGIILISGAIGIYGLLADFVVSVVGLVVAVALGLVAIRLPAWKDRIEDRRLS